MLRTRRVNEQNSKDNKGAGVSLSRNRTGIDSIRGLRSREVLARGARSVTGAADLALASCEDMLAGGLTPQEATVLTTAAGRVLKASELLLKYARGENVQLELPTLS